MLEKYFCSKCGESPQSEKEVFFGCNNCNNKLFKIKNDSSVTKNDFKSQNNPNLFDEDVTSIKINNDGVYSIDVDDLLKNDKNKLVTVTDKKGVHHIKI